MPLGLLLPFRYQVSFEAGYDTSAVLSTLIHYQLGKYLSGYPIPTIDHTQSHATCVFSTHTFLYEKNLHYTMSKDHSIYSYPLISFLQKKILRLQDHRQPYTPKYQVFSSLQVMNFHNSLHFLVIGDSFIINLIFGGFLASTPLMLAIRVVFLYSYCQV